MLHSNHWPCILFTLNQCSSLHPSHPHWRSFPAVGFLSSASAGKRSSICDQRRVTLQIQWVIHLSNPECASVQAESASKNKWEPSFKQLKRRQKLLHKQGTETLLNDVFWSIYFCPFIVCEEKRQLEYSSTTKLPGMWLSDMQFCLEILSRMLVH